MESSNFPCRFEFSCYFLIYGLRRDPEKGNKVGNEDHDGVRRVTLLTLFFSGCWREKDTHAIIVAVCVVASLQS